MHSRYAAVFGIENLELNQHYQTVNNQTINNKATDTKADSVAPEPISLTSQLFADIKRAIAPITINSVIQGTELQLHGDQLVLTNSQLSTADKRALWALMSDHLDKL